MSARKIVWALPLVTTALVMTACSDGTGPAPAARRTLSLNVTAGTSAGAAAAADTTNANGHQLVISKVELVLSEFELKRVATTTACTSSSADDGPSASSSDDGASHESGECEEFQTGPMLLDLPLGGAPRRVVTVDVDTGSYRQAEFKIHKPDDRTDGSFLAQHPDLDGVSVRVTGVYDGKPFVYTNDLTARQRQDLVPPVVVGAAGPTDFTLVIDIGRWFLTSAGALIDPATALKGGSNDNLVRDNIRRSFRCFEDKDRDGHED